MIAETRLVSTNISSSSMLRVFLIIESSCFLDSRFRSQREKKRCDLFLLTLDLAFDNVIQTNKLLA